MKLQLEFDDLFEKRTHLSLELYAEMVATYEATNSQNLYTMITDLERAVEIADLTDIQRDCVRFYYFEDYSTYEIGDIKGVSRQAITKTTKAAVKKVANVFRDWNYWTEGEDLLVKA